MLCCLETEGGLVQTAGGVVLSLYTGLLVCECPGQNPRQPREQNTRMCMDILLPTVRRKYS